MSSSDGAAGFDHPARQPRRAPHTRGTRGSDEHPVSALPHHRCAGRDGTGGLRGMRSPGWSTTPRLLRRSGRLHVAEMPVVESLDYLNAGDNVLWRELCRALCRLVPTRGWRWRTSGVRSSPPHAAQHAHRKGDAPPSPSRLADPDEATRTKSDTEDTTNDAKISHRQYRSDYQQVS